MSYVSFLDPHSPQFFGQDMLTKVVTSYLDAVKQQGMSRLDIENDQFAVENGPLIDGLPIKNGDFL